MALKVFSIADRSLHALDSAADCRCTQQGSKRDETEFERPSRLALKRVLQCKIKTAPLWLLLTQ